MCVCVCLHMSVNEKGRRRMEDIDGVKKDSHKEKALNIFHALDLRLLFL